MTRIVSYNLYQCPHCSQIHVKPNYGSISSYVPVDMFTKATDIKTCQKCHAKQAVNEFIFLGEERDPPSKSNMFYEHEIGEFLGKMMALILFRKYVAEQPYISLRERYPRLVN